MNPFLTLLTLPIEEPIIMSMLQKKHQFEGFGSTWSDQNYIFFTLPTDQFLAILAYGEAGNQGAEGMMAVLNVVRNRTLDRSFYDEEIYSLTGDAYKAVGLKYKQFSMFNPGNNVRPIAERIAQNFTGEAYGNSALYQAYQLSQSLIQGALADNTGGAQYYHATYVSPGWNIPLLGQIGDHLFYGSGISAALSSAYSTVSEVVTGATSSIEEALGVDTTTLVLMGLGIGTVIVVAKKRGMFKKLAI